VKAHIRAVGFDLGGVLVRLRGRLIAELTRDLAPAQAQAVQEILKDDFRGQETGHSLFEQYQLGRVTTVEFTNALATASGRGVGFVERELIAELVGENEEGVQLLRALQPRIPLGCYSNTCAIHWEYMLRTFPWMASFRSPCASHLIGIAKPTRAGFDRLCADCGVQPVECLFIDDRQVNVDGARAAGLEAILWTSAAEVRGELARFGLAV